MADNTTLPGTGDVISADDIAGVKVQRVKVQYGPDGTATDVDTATGLPTTSGYLEVSGSASANNTNLISTDAQLFRSVVVQVTGTFSATVQFQSSNDNTNWSGLLLAQVGSSTVVTSQATAATQWFGSTQGRYFRVRTTAYTSGTVTATVGFSSQAAPLMSSSVFGAFNNNIDAWPAQSTGAVLALSSGYLYNGSSWDRVKAANTADATSGTGLQGSGTMVFDGSNWRRAASQGVNGVAGVTPTPGTTGGWSTNSQTALSSTKTQVKSSAGTFGGYMIYNSNTSVAYVQVWDVASGSITVGTTAPTYVLSIPAGSAANLELTCGVNHATAINVAATTTPTGSTAPTTALTCAFFYK